MDGKIWKAEELEQLSPERQQKIFDDSIVWDLADAPTEIVARARAFAEERIQRETQQPD
ncbi:MAG: hypothetical protein ACTHN0_10495 [Aquihabitans sp.]